MEKKLHQYAQKNSHHHAPYSKVAPLCTIKSHQYAHNFNTHLYAPMFMVAPLFFEHLVLGKSNTCEKTPRMCGMTIYVVVPRMCGMTTTCVVLPRSSVYPTLGLGALFF
ncbi:hypothetical protein PFBG_00006 [Plasmodium falciparum 7G8]|uniref:Uncharacterized protein n=1 Tax=Plasmodium falciparum (isolate 7G8) TaxID=57266 RepID=W7FK74_PLAF8|nr:hypothetical protein PFBG_00006 [Plasmodium falciparum 7G8]